jgi:endonuclease/exonuclease/phosphatase family metal-dependent hydrolase
VLRSRRFVAALLVVLVSAPALLATALTTAATGAVAAPAAAGQPEPRPRPLRVATYNIHHEVDRHWSGRSDFVDQATWLADRLGMDVVFGANLDRDPLTPGAQRRQYGTAILSTHRIRSSTNILLPRPEGGEQRGLLEAAIKVRGVPVRVFTTHLQHDSQVERMAQIAQIRAVLADVPESVVLLGDLNATPESPEIAAITDDLVDTWVEAGVGDGYTFDAATPHARIDYVMTSDGIVARTAAVVATDASDHLPVVVDLGLPGGAPAGMPGQAVGPG